MPRSRHAPRLRPRTRTGASGALIETARAHGAMPVGYWFPPDLPATRDRNACREGRARVPDVGLYATLQRLRPPTTGDGFDRLYRVGPDGAGGFDVRPLP